MPVPICSNAEQEIINNYISEELSRIAKIENEIVINLQKSEALRQSILKKAFSGSLVAQDANDEPANVLLERIRTEKKFHLADNKTEHEKDVKSDNEFTEDYLTKEAAV